MLKDKQWFFIGPTLTAPTADKAEKSLQDGPLTTCFIRHWKGPVGNQCKPGCAHANSIIGYDSKRWYLQESIGKNFMYPRLKDLKKMWGLKNISFANSMDYAPEGVQLSDGTWYVNRHTECEYAILSKARYPLIFFDYDRANAYFIKQILKPDQMTFINKSIEHVEAADFINVGMAKRRCSLMGSKCQGVVEMSNGGFELIQEISHSKLSLNPVEVFRKKQMVIYLRNKDGNYIGIQKNSFELVIVDNKTDAAAFFTSNSRIIPFQFPSYNLGSRKLEKYNLNEPEPQKHWNLKDANLKNIASGYSMDVGLQGRITGRMFNKTSRSQRFDLGLSREWKIFSHSKQTYLRKSRHNSYAFKSDHTYKDFAHLRWQARQILTTKGKPFTEKWALGEEYFNIGRKENTVAPTDCLLAYGNDYNIKYLGHLGRKIVMINDTSVNDGLRWSFVYGDI